jgi:hypothetical protein
MNLKVVWMTKQTAERHARHAYNVAPDVQLGWMPYQILVTNGWVTSHTAFVTRREFKRWLQANGYRVQLQPYRGRTSDWVLRSGSIMEGAK